MKEEIERIHRMWEKKFSILQASMHALKDESYLRQTLQRQAATLHHASVSYAVSLITLFPPPLFCSSCVFLYPNPLQTICKANILESDCLYFLSLGSVVCFQIIYVLSSNKHKVYVVGYVSGVLQTYAMQY